MSPLTFLSVCFLFFIVVESSFFSKDDAQHVRELVQAQKRSDGTFGDLKTTHYAVSALVGLGDKLETKSLCAQTIKQFKTETTACGIQHALSTIKLLNCGAQQLTNDQKEILRGALEGEKVSEIFAAVRALSFVPSVGKELVTVKVVDDVLSLLSDLSLSDGTFLDSNEQEEGDHFSAASVYHTVALLNSILDISSFDDVETILFSSEDLLGEELIFADASGDRALQSASLLWTGLNALEAAFKGIKVSQEVVSEFANIFLSNKKVTSVEEAAFLVDALASLKANNFKHFPLVVTLENNAFNLASKGEDSLVKIKVTDVFGEFATDLKLYVNKVSPVDNDDVLIRNQEARKVNKNEFSFNFLATKPVPGFYSVDFSVLTEGKNSPYFALTSELVVKVMTSVTVDELELRVTDTLGDSDEFSASELTVAYPKKEPSVTKVHGLQFISLSFSLKSGAKAIDWVKQVFVKFTNEEAGVEAFFFAEPVDRKYQLTVDLKEDIEKFRAFSGTYKVELLVGDSLLLNTISWEFTDLALHFGSKSRKLAEVVGPLPEIHHEFRQPEPRPSEQLSRIFTLLVLSPFLILVIGWLSVGGLFSGFPSNVFALVTSLGFLGSIGSILYLFTKFW
eukprot:CAMPEP_0174260484 /NCGR_PEP_ID=MMETSP0439-20130205/9738_1 /TAXON_ID=0 /ORGANISM="Stereomyxa ramosa, Strain Chinc5" /LENGTH=622 /DNA_ID=CAMNT_0015344735 /DNA_START=42 /DNA_END=1907 /DNA_ORIENTATION=-